MGKKIWWILAGVAIVAIIAIIGVLVLGIAICGIGSLVILNSPDEYSTTPAPDTSQLIPSSNPAATPLVSTIPTPRPTPLSATPTVVPTRKVTPVPTMILTATPVPDQKQVITNPTPEPGYYTRTYSWEYESYDYTWELNIPRSYYNFYRSQPHNRESDFSMYAMSDYDREYLQSLVDKLTETANRDGYSEYDRVMLVVAFVQSLPYTKDDVTTGFDEYPRYPLETLVDNGGDCEDTSILTAALLSEMGYGVVLLEPPGHMAVGLKGANTLPGTYVEYNGNRYYYVETTGSGYGIGVTPPEYQNEKMHIYPMRKIPKIDVQFNASYSGADSTSVYYRVHCDTKNIGTGTASNVSVYIAALALSQGDNRVWLPTQTVVLGDYEEGASGWAEATIKIPRGETTQIECIAEGDNFYPTVVKSMQFDT